MKFEYTFDGLKLMVLDETYYSEVLNYYSRNKEDFDKYETKKPDNFYTEEFIRDNLRAEYNAMLRGGYVRFFLFSNDLPGQILGSISFSHIHTGNTSSCNIGYKLDKNYRHLGLAQSMIKEGLKIIINEKNIHRIEAYIHPDNTPSINLIKNLGFIEEGIAHSYANIGGHWQDHLRFVYIS